MANVRLLAIIALVGLLSGVASAGCATTAYSNACSSCSFTQNGKMDEECYNEYIEIAQMCYVAAYPDTMRAYRAGNCSQIDTCKRQLSACVDESKTGNDRNDCSSGVVTHCFAAADSCMASANTACEKIGISTFVQAGSDVIGSILDICDSLFILLPAFVLCIAIYERKPAES